MMSTSVLKLKKPTELRKSLFETLDRTKVGDKFLIHHKSGSAVLQDERDYLALLHEIETLKSINRGLQDYMDGKIHTHSEMKDLLRAHVKNKKK